MFCGEIGDSGVRLYLQQTAEDLVAMQTGKAILLKPFNEGEQIPSITGTPSRCELLAFSKGELVVRGFAHAPNHIANEAFAQHVLNRRIAAVTREILGYLELC